mgnify:CR=1 FL=1
MIVKLVPLVQWEFLIPGGGRSCSLSDQVVLAPLTADPPGGKLRNGFCQQNRLAWGFQTPNEVQVVGHEAALKKKWVANRNSQDALHIIWVVSGNVCQSVCILSGSVNDIRTEVLVMMLSATARVYLGISSASWSWS